jgi:hypothetical protein
VSEPARPAVPPSLPVTPSSPGLRPAAVATLANDTAWDDVRLLLLTLELWNPADPPVVFLYCDSRVSSQLVRLRYAGEIVAKEALNRYTGLDRLTMERMRGRTHATLFADCVAQKCDLLEWAFSELPDEQHHRGILFCDADLCFLSSLPSIPPSSRLALSAHDICAADARRFGHYNAGLVWTNDIRMPIGWRARCRTSRYLEQACLEDVARQYGVLECYEFPIQQNYGWWRLFQGDEPAETLARAWGIDRTPGRAGLTVEGCPLGSIHTHWGESQPSTTRDFNQMVYRWLCLLQPDDKVGRLLARIVGMAPWLRSSDAKGGQSTAGTNPPAQLLRT